MRSNENFLLEFLFVDFLHWMLQLAVNPTVFVISEHFNWGLSDSEQSVSECAVERTYFSRFCENSASFNP